MKLLAIFLSVFAYVLLIGGIVLFFATDKRPIEHSNLIDEPKTNL